MSRSVGFFIFFSLQVLQHILDLGKQEHREGEKRDPRGHWSSIRPSLVRWCRPALGGDGRSSGRRRVAEDVEVDGGMVQGLRASRRFSASRRSVATRFSVGELSGGEPHDNHHSPHLSLLYGAARRGPTSCVRLSIPDQDASQGPVCLDQDASQGPVCRWANW